MAIALLVVYGLLLSFILLFSITQLQLTITYVRNKRKGRGTTPQWPIGKPLPVVTVQLPLYNERYVAERLIDQVAKLDWPWDRLEIQVLDDSTDETCTLCAERVAFWRAKGIDILEVRRPDRAGYKAGALAYGTERARGEFIAVFDADFMPPTDMLRQVMPWFLEERVGLVQARWGHLNRGNNLLTRLQAFGLDAHFSVEQSGRNALGCFINFNGTAGVWRKSTIMDAGGWQPDTLTEDLDLSYRAQLRGWTFCYLEHVVAPAELPAVMNALKAQQYRWNKGAAECVVKNLGKVLRDPALPLGTKLHAALHLMNSTIFISILGTVLLSVPILIIKQRYPEYTILFNVAVLFTFALLVLIAFYAVAHKNYKQGWRGALHFFRTFPLFLALSMGLSLHNAIAVLEGYIGRRTPFVRTPKVGASGDGAHWGRNGYLKSAITPLLILELAIACYAVFGIAYGVRVHDLGLLPYHLMVAFGFGAVAWYSLVHSLRTAG
jgi:cellulose synthase/poly-beta-1,6-N-acetylglucosamine synthase-like glycosyltransferase